VEVTANIPDGWQELSVFELADRQKARFDDGDWVEAQHITNAGVRLIQTGNIGVGIYIEKDTRKYIYEASFASLKCKLLEVGDLLICRLAEPAGRTCILPHIGDARVITSVDVSIFRPDPKRFDRGYLVQYLSTPEWFEAVVENVGGTTHKRISRSALGKIKVPIPIEKSEQSAIATALSDVDALLAAQDALIAKKRAIKQGAMQELLTGKRRLPGFGGEWEVKRLGDVAHIKTGSRNNEHKVEGGDYPFFVRSEFVERIDGYSYDCEAILVPGEGKIGEIFHYITGRFDVHQRVYAITQFAADVSGQFVHLFMKAHFGQWAMQNTVKATVDSLRLPTFQNFQMRLPPTKDEQVEIVKVLCDMDAELTSLEAQRAKTVQLKQGMMQALLTGRIRLV